MLVLVEFNKIHMSTSLWPADVLRKAALFWSTQFEYKDAVDVRIKRLSKDKVLDINCPPLIHSYITVISFPMTSQLEQTQHS